MPGPTASARDPVIDLLACAIPPHFVQPWATVEVVRDSGSDDAGDGSEGGGKKGPPPQTVMSGAGGNTTSTLLRRPESVLELLRGCAVRTGGVVHLLPTPMDAVCQGVRLLCRRAPEFVIPPLLTSAPETSARRGGVTAGDHRRSKKDSSSGRPRDAGRHLGGRERNAGEELEAGLGGTGGAPGRGPLSGRDGAEKEKSTRAAMAQGVRTDIRHTPHAPAAATHKSRGGHSAGGDEGDWASRLSEWGVVTSCSEVVTPHKALEVQYHDVAAAAAATAAPATAAAAAAEATTVGREGAEDVMVFVFAGLIWVRVVFFLRERGGVRLSPFVRGDAICSGLSRLRNPLLC